MTFEAHSITADDGHVIAARMALPSTQPRGLVQVLHGLAEHCARYERLAKSLNEAGWAVVTHDHRGHGESVADERDRGHFGDREGWQRVVEDVRTVRAHGRTKVSEGPLVLLGHSMGSFIALAEQVGAPGTVDRLVLSGSGSVGGLLQEAGWRIARFEAWRQGGRGRSDLLHRLSFGDFNKAFEPTRTEFDWLSRDEAEVDRYVDDPHCGFRGSNQLWADFVRALVKLADRSQLSRLPPELPVYFFSGSEDPVGARGVGVRSIADQLRAAGVRHVTVKLYPGGRHEALNETNRAEVMADLIEWIDG